MNVIAAFVCKFLNSFVVYRRIVYLFFEIEVKSEYCCNYRKKRGHQPTGMVVQMAKAGGFTSVSDMIHVKGAQNVSNYKRVKEMTASLTKVWFCLF